jgi:hypothetical protein
MSLSPRAGECLRDAAHAVLDLEILRQSIFGHDVHAPHSGRYFPGFVVQLAAAEQVGKRPLAVDFGDAYLAPPARREQRQSG